MRSDILRETFLDFFEQRGHKRIPSSSLVPAGDPTLLFANAGMNQFKDYFTGRQEAPFPTACSSQKCVRAGGKHNDLENVGRTARHHTFFEMLGNFSFGDYFKRDAIRYAWEFVTKNLGLPPDRLVVTVFREDDEAYDLWHKEIGVASDKLFRLDEKDNYWMMGDTGPQGPCSEIHFDQGAGPGGIWADETIYGDSDRFLEIWNLVFMQFERHPDGRLTDLPRPCVDTGGGLERMVAVTEGVYSNYNTDLFLPLIHHVAHGGGATYGASVEADVSLRVIADHARSISFLLADGVLPSNLGRGYVLRRIIRRAVRHARLLGFDKPMLADACGKVVEQMGGFYPELVERRDFVLTVATREEESFLTTLDRGLGLLDEEIRQAKSQDGGTLKGEVVFQLYDTFGFPADLTALIAEEHGLAVDEEGFHSEMQKQRERGKKSWKGSATDAKAELYSELRAQAGETVFTGYEEESATSEIVAVFENGERVEQAQPGAKVELVLANTPFYGESGGQIGDRGLILGAGIDPSSIDFDAATHRWPEDLPMPEGPDAALVVRVDDTIKPVEGLTVHIGEVLAGSPRPALPVRALVNRKRRRLTRANHSVTHLLLDALRTVLGDHVRQEGSWVGPDRMRFDFAHFQAITPEELERIERHVQNAIVANHAASTVVLPIEEAKARGAIATFGEKYGDTVRVVSIGDSMELCGGTHVSRSGDIGLFKIFSESSIAAGIRRIEGLTGEAALLHIQKQLSALQHVSQRLSCSPEKADEAVGQLMEQLKQERKLSESLKKEQARSQTGNLIDHAESIGDVKLVAAKIDSDDIKALRELVQELCGNMESGVVALAAEAGGKLALVVAVTPDLQKHYPAGKIVAAAAAAAGARGGGKPALAQAGGGDPAKSEAVFEALRAFLKG